MSRLVVGRWGNSLAVRLPKELAEELGLSEGVELDAEVEKGTLRAVPRRKRSGRRTLSELVKGMTPENRHEATDWGPPVGKEIW